MDPATQLALVSLGVAFGAAGFSLWSAITAQRAHALALAQHEERATPLRVYLADGYVERDLATGNRRFAFLLSITNSATLDNSIANAELRIHYRSQQRHLARIDLPGSPDLASVGRSATKLVPPVHLSARQSVSGWIVHEAPASVFQNHDIDLYEVRVTDANGRVASWKTVHVKEVPPSGKS